MSQTARLVDRRLAITLVILQTLMVLIIAVLTFALTEPSVAKSATSGAIVCCFANAYFAWQAFRTAGATASRQILTNMSHGMIGKFVIVIVGFILILTQVKPLSGLALFGGFILVQSLSWFTPWVLNWVMLWQNKSTRDKK